MNTTATARKPVWARPICRPFPGEPDQIALVRDFVARRLRTYGCPEGGLDDIVLCADELATNAIRHTLSGWTGGYFVVTVRAANSTARIEVADCGPANNPAPDDDDAHGLGLVLVEALARWSGYEKTRHGGLAWFEYAWDTESDVPAPRTCRCGRTAACASFAPFPARYRPECRLCMIDADMAGRRLVELTDVPLTATWEDG